MHRIQNKPDRLTFFPMYLNFMKMYAAGGKYILQYLDLHILLGLKCDK